MTLALGTRSGLVFHTTLTYCGNGLVCVEQNGAPGLPDRKRLARPPVLGYDIGDSFAQGFFPFKCNGRDSFIPCCFH
ncbi:MAG: hypothetical protein U1E27_06255 [Kiritimatiellia bacterium]|nr:hypothetical protein [Kiritimatiellia bacterium]